MLDLFERKKFKLSETLDEEMTLPEVMDRYEPYLNKVSSTYAKYAEEVYYKHLYYFDLDDIKQQAYIGVIEAFERYNYSKGITLYTYLSNTVDGTIKKYLLRKTHMRQTLNPYKVKEYSFDNEMPTSGNDGEVVDFKNIIADPFNQFEYDKVLDKDETERILSILTPRERDMVVLKYCNEATYKTIGLRHNVTKARVEQIVKAALAKMEKYIKFESKKGEMYNAKSKTKSKRSS